MTNDIRDFLVAEYALGSLSGAELTEAQRRMQTDPKFRRTVDRWQRRMALLADALPSKKPPHAVLERALQSIDVAREKRNRNGRLRPLSISAPCKRACAIGSAPSHPRAPSLPVSLCFGWAVFRSPGAISMEKEGSFTGERPNRPIVYQGDLILQTPDSNAL